MILKHKSKFSMITLICTSVVAFAKPVTADIVYFENPAEGEEGHFNWHWQGDVNFPITFEHWLNITQPSTNQFELDTNSSVAQLAGGDGGDSENGTIYGALVARVPNSILTHAFEFGEDIAASGNFDDYSLHVADDGGGTISDFDESRLAYIGVQTENGNFGWIAVIRHLNNLSTTGWAYETIPGKTILAGEIPAPSMLAHLLIFTIGGIRRRRKR